MLYDAVLYMKAYNKLKADKEEGLTPIGISPSYRVKRLSVSYFLTNLRSLIRAFLPTRPRR